MREGPFASISDWSTKLKRLIVDGSVSDCCTHIYLIYYKYIWGEDEHHSRLNFVLGSAMVFFVWLWVRRATTNEKKTHQNDRQTQHNLVNFGCCTSLRRVVRVLIWFLYSSSRWLAYRFHCEWFYICEIYIFYGNCFIENKI